MLHLYWLVLTMMVSLSPSSSPILRHGQLATAITLTLQVEGPLFAHDDSLARSAALMVAVAYRESGLDPRAVGDSGQSFGAFQQHRSSGGSLAETDDPLAQAVAAHRLIRSSITTDRAHPLAAYARGPAFRSLEAQRLSADRMALARELAKLER